MKTEYAAIEQALLGQTRQQQLPKMVAELKGEAMRVLGLHESRADARDVPAVADVREQMKIGFINLELQTQGKPHELDRMLRDKTVLRDMGFTPAQTYCLMRSAQDFLDDGIVTGQHLTRLHKAILADVTRALPLPAVVAPVAAPVVKPAQLLLAAPTPKIDFAALLRQPQLIDRLPVLADAVVPPKPAERIVPTLTEVLATRKDAHSADEYTRAGLLAREMTRLKTELSDTLIGAMRQGQKVETVAAVATPLRQAFRNLDKKANLSTILQSEADLLGLGFTLAQANRLAKSAQKFMSGDEDAFNTARFMSAVKVDLARQTPKPAAVAVSIAAEPVVPSAAPLTLVQRAKSLFDRAKAKLLTPMGLAVTTAIATVVTALVLASGTVPKSVTESAAAPDVATPVAVAKADTLAPVALGPTTALGVLAQNIGQPVTEAKAPAVQAPVVQAPVALAPAVTPAQPVKPAKVSAPPAPVFNQQIADVQTTLMAQGMAYQKLQADGVTGKPSQQFSNAVSYFQFSNGLAVDGKLNRDTVLKLNSLKASPAPV
jgi:hypothetical protein